MDSNALIPANPEAEQAVLGSLLIDPGKIVDVAQILATEDFYVHRNQWIYQAILDLHAANVTPDIITVADKLAQRNQLDEVGGNIYIDSLLGVTTSTHVHSYAKIVEQYAVKRRLLVAAGRIAQIASESEDAATAISQSLQVIEDSTRRKGDKQPKTLTVVLDETIAKAREAARIRAAGGRVSIPFGIKKLDEATGGMWPDEGDVIVIGAKSSTGKSQLTIGIAHQAAMAGSTGYVVSLEMQDNQVAERILGPASGYQIIELRSGEILDWDVLEDAKKTVETDNLYIDDSTALSVVDLSNRIRKMHMRHGIEFVVVDYMQLLSGGKKFENRTQELSHIVRSIKAVAKELRIAIILVAQLNRDYSKRMDKKPVMSDLEGSSQIEKEASVVIMIHRVDPSIATEEELRKATLILVKVRQGPKTEFDIGWDGRYGRFTEDPIPLNPDERQEFRERLALQCGAWPLQWSSWLLSRTSTAQGILASIRSVYTSLGSERNMVSVLAEALKNGSAPDMDVADKLGSFLVNAGHGYKHRPELVSFLAAVHRANVLYKVQHSVVPALLEKRFAIFSGYSTRGKTFMARIIQNMIIRENGIPVVWLNWNRFMRDIRETYNGNGELSEGDVWKMSRAPILILDDPDKLPSEWSVRQMYDILEESMGMNGTDRGVLIVLNHNPESFHNLMKQHGHLGHAVSHRAFRRSVPVWIDFDALPIWDFEEKPLF